MTNLTRGALLLAGACLLGGCGPDDAERASAALETWQDEGPRSYVYTFQRSCFCDDTEPMRITVRDGDVDEAVGLETGLPKEDSVTMTELLQDVVEHAERDPDEFDAEYDGDLGFLRSMSYDESKATADDEMRYTVSCFSANLKDCDKPASFAEGECSGTPTEPDSDDPTFTCADGVLPIGRITGTSLVCCPAAEL
jgi:hypothetical protein